MKIVLLTGIYPPDIGGPATYVAALAQELQRSGHVVTVITYGAKSDIRSTKSDTVLDFPIVSVSRGGGPLFRWRRYAAAIRRHAADADVLYAFSSVSCGVPLILSRLTGPKRVLRLGGDFLWERYTDRGGMLSLAEWYASTPRGKGLLERILKKFDHIVFSTKMQQSLYERMYEELPRHSVLENALPTDQPTLHLIRVPFRLLFMGRFVRFKNLPSLLQAVAQLSSIELSLVGDGPEKSALQQLIQKLELQERVAIQGPVSGKEKRKLFDTHELLVLPSVTEISPNVALEARAAGLPVLLTTETGLSEKLTAGMTIAPLRTAADIVSAIESAKSAYNEIAIDSARPTMKRGWKEVMEDHVRLFQSLS